MEITVRLFATLRQRAGWSSKVIEAPEGATVSQILDHLAVGGPELDFRGRSLYAAVNQEYAKMDQPVHGGDEVAFFPPVSGGH